MVEHIEGLTGTDKVTEAVAIPESDSQALEFLLAAAVGGGQPIGMLALELP